jgi:hypothetical protein
MCKSLGFLNQLYKLRDKFCTEDPLSPRWSVNFEDRRGWNGVFEHLTGAHFVTGNRRRGQKSQYLGFPFEAWGISNELFR